MNDLSIIIANIAGHIACAHIAGRRKITPDVAVSMAVDIVREAERRADTYVGNALDKADSALADEVVEANPIPPLTSNDLGDEDLEEKASEQKDTSDDDAKEDDTQSAE